MTFERILPSPLKNPDVVSILFVTYTLSATTLPLKVMTFALFPTTLPLKVIAFTLFPMTLPFKVIAVNSPDVSVMLFCAITLP